MKRSLRILAEQSPTYRYPSVIARRGDRGA
jgi:hypothetical protein